MPMPSHSGGYPLPRPNSAGWLPLLGVIVFTLIWFGLLAKRPLYDPDEGGAMRKYPEKCSRVATG